MRKPTLIILFLLSFSVFAQSEKEFAEETFKETRIVNGQSVITNQKGQLKFIISHRFGNISDGIDEFFGLDQATIRFGLDYGITNWLTIGIGRSSFEKTVDGFAKAAILRQTKDNKTPISITALTSIAARTIDDSNPELENKISSDLFYTYQVMFARKFSDRVSLQLMPTMVHRNLVATSDESNDVFSMGAASRYQLSKIVSFQIEYYYVLPDQLDERYKNSLSLGFDIKTKNHVFQLHVSNSQGMIEKFFIGETTGSWEDGDIFLGFNISRDFQLTGRKYK
jgi:hypothetical protein